MKQMPNLTQFNQIAIAASSLVRRGENIGVAINDAIEALGFPAGTTRANIGTVVAHMTGKSAAPRLTPTMKFTVYGVDQFGRTRSGIFLTKEDAQDYIRVNDIRVGA